MGAEFISKNQVKELTEFIHNREQRRSNDVDSMILRQIYLYLGLKEDHYGTGCYVKEDNN